MTTPKKKHLIELMIEAGVKWPDGAEYAVQDKRDLYVWFYNIKPKRVDFDSWAGGASGCIVDGIRIPSLCRNWHQTIVTREQYAEAVAATAMTPSAQQETQPDGEWEPVEWGDWSSGDTVRFDGFTNTQHTHWSFKVGTLYVIGKHNAPIAGNGQYPECNWGFSFSRRKKQNEQHIEAQPSPEYCASVMRQMPDNTIEQLTADYRAKAGEADSLQAVADEALKAANEALLALQKAGELIGLLIAIDTNPKPVEQPVEQAQPEITDWRDLQVGDVIKCMTQGNPNYHLERLNWIIGEECQVIKLENPRIAGQPILAKFKNGEKWWIGKFKFIRRP